MSLVEGYPPVIKQYLKLKRQIERSNAQTTVIRREAKKLEPAVINELRNHNRCFLLAEMTEQQRDIYGPEGKFRLKEDVPNYGKCTKDHLQESLSSWLKGFVPGAIESKSQEWNDALFLHYAQHATKFIWDRLSVKRSPKIIVPHVTRTVSGKRNKIPDDRDDAMRVALPPTTPLRPPTSSSSSTRPGTPPPAASNTASPYAMVPYKK